MCDPVSITMGVTAAIGAAMSMMQASQQQSQQREAAQEQNRLFIANNENTNEALRQQYAQTQIRQGEENVAAAEKKLDIAAERRKQVATLRASSGEAGVAGISVDALINETYGQEGKARDRVDQNLDSTQSQLQREMEGQRLRAESNINSVGRAFGPSPAALGLAIGGAAVDGIGQGVGIASRAGLFKTKNKPQGVRQIATI